MSFGTFNFLNTCKTLFKVKHVKVKARVEIHLRNARGKYLL